MKEYIEQQQQQRQRNPRTEQEAEPIFPMKQLNTKSIIVTNGDQIIDNKNNQNTNELTENDKLIENDSMALDSTINFKNDKTTIDEPATVMINDSDKLDSLSSANPLSEHNDNLSINNQQRPCQSHLNHQTSINTSSSFSTIVNTNTSKKSPKKIKRKSHYERPPDGGWGWMVVLASFIINLIADGVSLSFGVIFVELVDYFNESKSKTAWIGSLFLSIPLITGPIGSSLVDQFGCRKVTLAGALLSSAGFFLGQFSTCVEHLFFAFSLSGFGLALCYVTSIVSVAYWFDRRRSLATGLAVCGSGFGTFLFAPLIIFLQNEYGWRGTLLILSGVFLNMLCCGFLIPDVTINTSYDDSSSSSSSSSNDLSDLNSNLSEPVDNYDSDDDRPTSMLGSSPQESHRLLMKQHTLCPRPLSESKLNEESLPRHTSSLINIPTFIKTDNKVSNNNNDKNETHSNNSYDELTFRRGGYLHNLICRYPHLLIMFLPWDMHCDDLTVKTKLKLQSNSTTVPLISASPIPPKASQKVVEFGSTHHMDSNLNLNNINTDNHNNNDHIKNVEYNGILKSSPNFLQTNNNHTNNNNTSSRFGQLLNFARASIAHTNNNSNNNHNDILFNQQDHQQQPQASRVNRLNHLRLPRGSLTYRNAMLVINKYRLKASSAPDIYRTSMITINEDKSLTLLENLKEFLYNMIDISIFKSFRYSIFCLSNFLLYVCIDVPYVYIPDQVITSGAADKEGASHYISIIGVFNTFGVVFVGWIGDKPWIDASFIYAILVSISGIVMAVIPLTTDSYLIGIQSAIYGFCISANYSLVSVILVELISLDSFTTAYGMLLLVQGFGSLIGPPLAGWIFDVSGNYDNAFYITGISILLSGLLVLPVGRKKNCFIWHKHQQQQRHQQNDDDDDHEFETTMLKDKFNNKQLSSLSNNNNHSKSKDDDQKQPTSIFKTRPITTIEEDSEI